MVFKKNLNGLLLKINKLIKEIKLNKCTLDFKKITLENLIFCQD